MTTYKKDKETGEWILKSEWNEKYADRPMGRGPMIINRKFENYVSPTSGEVITSFRQREEDMRAAGCVDYEPSLKDEIDRNVKIEDQKLEKDLDNTVDEVFDSMSGEKREKLAKEIVSSDIGYERN